MILKIALLIFGLLPAIMFIVAFILGGTRENLSNIFFYVLYWLAILSFPSVFIYYVISVYTSKNIPKEQKHLWAALLFFGSLLVYPFYWYLHVWRELKKEKKISGSG